MRSKKQRAKQPAGGRSIYIRPVLREEIDLDSLTVALLRLARQQLADEKTQELNALDSD
jgi:hypothetical protein